MNLFILDLNHKMNAQYHIDCHACKIITEANQVLCGAHYMLNSTPESEIPYKLTHQNHPISVWVRKSLDNYLWTCDYCQALCNEYTYRYGKIHKGQHILNWCKSHIPKYLISIGLTSFVQAMPERYRCDDVVKAYRSYYLEEKQHLFKWKRREIPEWVKNDVD